MQFFMHKKLHLRLNIPYICTASNNHHKVKNIPASRHCRGQKIFAFPDLLVPGTGRGWYGIAGNKVIKHK